MAVFVRQNDICLDYSFKNENCYKSHLRITEPCCVDLDESGTVDEDLGAHVTECDKLLTIFQPLRRLHLSQGFQKSSSLSGTQPTDKLYQVAHVVVSDALVDVHANLAGPVDKLDCQAFKKLFVGELQKRIN